MNLFLNIINTTVFEEIGVWILALVVFVIVLGVIILIHEGGHFFFAKKAGILCHEFSIGMGPVVKSVKKGETSYSIRAVPIGGFVSMAGEDTNESMLQIGQEVSLGFKEVEESSLTYSKDGATTLQHRMVRAVSEISITDKVVKEITGKVVKYDLYSAEGNPMYIVLDVEGKEEEYLVARDAFYVLSEKQQIQMAPYERCYESKTKLQRFLTVFAGPFMNFVLAFLIFLVVGLASGVPNEDSSEIGKISEGYHASTVLQAGDVIVKLDETEINSWNDISKYLETKLGAKDIKVTYKRGEDIKVDTIKLTNFSYRIGVSNRGFEDYTGSGLQVSLLFDDHYVASKAGIKNGDVIIGYEYNDEYKEVKTWEELFGFLDKNKNLESLKLKVKVAIRNQNGELVKDENGDYKFESEPKDVPTDVWTERSIHDIASGIAADTVIGISSTTRFDFFGGIANAFVLFWNSITAVFVTLGALFGNSQITINELSGPVGIFAVVKQYLATDIITFLSFVGLISANIGLVNLLPLPALDGGRIVFIGYELVTGKKVNKKLETALINIVFWLVMILFVYITFKDIFRLF